MKHVCRKEKKVVCMKVSASKSKSLKNEIKVCIELHVNV